MAELITMPKLGFDMAEGTLVEWIRQVGDEIAEGDVVAMIETDKANVEVTSFKAGTLRALLVGEGESVPIGVPIAVIGAPDEAIDMARVEAEQAPEPEAATATPAAPAEPGVAKPEVPISTVGRRLASPVARRMAEELGMDLRQLQGSGPSGRIIKRDIEAYLVERDRVPEAVSPPPMPTPAHEPSAEGYRVQPLSPLRRTIGRRMAESKQQAPHFYITIGIDMASATALRQQLNELLPEESKISVNDLIVKAAAIALREFPNLNASFAGDEIHLHDRVNIGLAVARDVGLVTTVIQDCDTKPLAQIAADAREVIARAREGRMRPEDMLGGTFTVSNLGMYGVEDFCAIINPPHAAILAVGAVQRVPVVNTDGQLEVGTCMKATLSADHRVTDGAEAARFLQALKMVLEQPMRLVL